MELKRFLYPLLQVLGLSMALLAVQEAQAQPVTLKVRKEDSQVGFSIYKWAVFREEGRFKDFEGTVEFDPGNLGATKVDFVVQANSIDSRNEGRDKALRSQGFFNVSQYPTLTFRSMKATRLDKDRMSLEGDLTLRGVTRRVTFPVQVVGITYAGGELGTLVGFEATFSVNREDFRIAEGWDIIGKEATIHLIIGASYNGRIAAR